MERLFSPCTQLHDVLEREGLLDEVIEYNPEPLQELNLNVSTEEFLCAERAFTFADLYEMLGNEDTVAWLTPHAAVVRNHGEAVQNWNMFEESYGICYSVDGKDIIAFARSPEHLLEICDIVLRVLAVSVVDSVIIHRLRSAYGLINAPTLAYMMEQCQSLKYLSLNYLTIDEDHIRVLGDLSRPDLEIVLERCKITSAGASVLAEVLGRNQGPTKLVSCEIDNFVLADGLRGNSRLKSLKLRISSNLEVGNREVLALSGALKENEGLVDLNLNYRFYVSEWGAICASLKTHPTLEVLDLHCAAFTATTTAPAVLKSRIQALLDMVKVNMSIHTIRLHDRYSNHALFQDSVIPYLETNRLRPRLLAIQRTRPIPYRAKVLGRALMSAHTDPNRFWMLLLGNAEVAFPSTTLGGWEPDYACY
jgi:hypothetical protein